MELVETLGHILAYLASERTGYAVALADSVYTWEPGELFDAIAYSPRGADRVRLSWDEPAPGVNYAAGHVVGLIEAPTGRPYLGPLPERPVILYHVILRDAIHAHPAG